MGLRSRLEITIDLNKMVGLVATRCIYTIGCDPIDMNTTTGTMDNLRRT